MTKQLSAFIAGLIFDLGLIVSGMANPAKVLAFLDLDGLWDPSLIFVMLGAIAIATVAFRYAGRRSRSLLGEPLQWPSARSIDRRLMAGSALFGVGWGLAGICPGPALVLIGAGSAKGAVFAGAMLAGMAIFDILERWKRARETD
jgi:uncharacterized membrane protein YedE/YeeE